MKGTGKVKKFEIALFLKIKEEIVRIKKSTELTLNFDPQTEEYDYIADESPSTDLERYAPKIEGMPLTMYREEKDFQTLWDFAYNLKVGGDSQVEAIMVFKFDEDAETTGKWKAWKAAASLVVKQMNAVEGTLEFDLPFRGTVERGTVTEKLGKPEFTPASAAA